MGIFCGGWGEAGIPSPMVYPRPPKHVRLASGQYASYWNAFLFKLYFLLLHQTCHGTRRKNRGNEEYECSPGRIPTRTGKPGKWEGIFQSGKSQEILNKLEKSGKTQNAGNSGNFRQIVFVIF